MSKIVRHDAFSVRYSKSESHGLLQLALGRQLAECFPGARVVTTEKRMGRDLFFAVVSGDDDSVIVEDGMTGEPICTGYDDGGVSMIANVLIRRRYDGTGSVLRLALGPSLDPGAFLDAVDRQMKYLLVEADRTPTLEFHLEDAEMSIEEIPKGTPPPIPREALWT